MNDYFYYLGILYVAIQCYNLIHSIFRSYDDIQLLLKNISKDMPSSIESLSPDKLYNALGHTREHTHGKKGSVFISILLMAFIICGAVYATEYIMFQFILLISVVCFITPIAGIIINALSSKEFFITAMMEGVKNMTKSKSMMIINVVQECIKIAVVGFVVYNHFLG